VRLAIHYPVIAGEPAAMARTLADTARAAEDGGAATFTLMDHWFQMEQLGGPAEPMLEGYTSLGFVAAHTSTIELGLLVTGVTYRHPGLLAKTVATLDVLSGGRAMLGLGAAWYEREHTGLGVPFPPMSERFDRLEEALQVCQRVWSDDTSPYEGTHYRLAEPVGLPAPLHRPRVLVGGSGEKRTLPLVARHADACNLFGTDVPTVRRKLEVLDRACEAEGRDPATVQRTVISGGDPQDAAVLRELEQLAALGVEQVWFSAPGEDPAGWTARTAEALVPRLADLGPQ
jgi:F420-dependent oxidoreductase-like protein